MWPVREKGTSDRMPNWNAMPNWNDINPLMPKGKFVQIW